MKVINKKHKKKKIDNFIKKNKLIFFFFNIYSNINELMFFKQHSKNKNVDFLITFKSEIQKTFDNSIYINLKKLNSQVSILTLKNFLSFKLLLAIKINSKIFHKNQIKKNFSFHYTNNKLLLFKFNIVNLKIKSK
jgi:hypothetical protein